MAQALFDEVKRALTLDTTTCGDAGFAVLERMLAETSEDEIRIFWAMRSFIHADVGEGGPMHHACYCGDVRVVRVLLSVHPDKREALGMRDSHQRTPMILAARQGHLKVVEYFFHVWAILNGFDNIDDYRASKTRKRVRGDMPEHGVGYVVPTDMGLASLDTPLEEKTNTNGQTAIHQAAMNNHVAMVEYLVKCGVHLWQLDKTGRSALHISAYQGHYAVSVALIRLGLTVTSVDSRGRNAIHVAAVRGHAELVKLFLDTGAHIDAPDTEGDTALTLASWKGHLTTVNVLIERGANIHATNLGGNNGVHLACCSGGHLDIVDRVLSVDPSMLDMPNVNGRTPLHLAALNGNVSIVEYLLQEGASVVSRAMHLSNAAQFALQYGAAIHDNVPPVPQGVYIVRGSKPHTIRRVRCLVAIFRAISDFKRCSILEANVIWNECFRSASKSFDVAVLLMLSTYASVEPSADPTVSIFTVYLNSIRAMLSTASSLQAAVAAGFTDRAHDLLLSGADTSDVIAGSALRTFLTTQPLVDDRLTPFVFKPEPIAVDETDVLLYNARLGWTRQTHVYLFGTKFRSMIASVCLVKTHLGRVFAMNGQNQLPHLPFEMWMYLLSFVQRKWFLPSKRGSVMTSALETRLMEWRHQTGRIQFCV